MPLFDPGEHVRVAKGDYPPLGTVGVVTHRMDGLTYAVACNTCMGTLTFAFQEDELEAV